MGVTIGRSYWEKNAGCGKWGNRVQRKVSYASEREEVNERLEKDCMVWSLMVCTVSSANTRVSLVRISYNSTDKCVSAVRCNANCRVRVLAIVRCQRPVWRHRAITPVKFIKQFFITPAFTRTQQEPNSRNDRTLLLLTKYYVAEYDLLICLLVRAFAGHRLQL